MAAARPGSGRKCALLRRPGAPDAPRLADRDRGLARPHREACDRLRSRARAARREPGELRDPRHAAASRGVGGRSARPLLWRRDALAAVYRGHGGAGNRRAVGAPHHAARAAHPRAAHHRCAALSLARPDARLGAPLPVARVRHALHRLDGAAQAQRARLAPDRRPGLAARGEEVSAPHRSRSLARAGGPRGGAGHRPGHRPAAPLRRLLQSG